MKYQWRTFESGLCICNYLTSCLQVAVDFSEVSRAWKHILRIWVNDLSHFALTTETVQPSPLLPDLQQGLKIVCQMFQCTCS